MTVKPGEENGLVLRCYECHGKEASIALTGDLGLEIADSVDLLERKQENGDRLKEIKPWQIATFKLNSYGYRNNIDTIRSRGKKLS